MTQPLISIIMPAYNAEKYIAASIRSVLAQTYRNWELLIVDDGSTDETAAIAQSFLPLDSRIKYIFQQNRKLAAARNVGIRNSTGELVAFLDADDLWLRDKLALQVTALAGAQADLIFSDGFIFAEDDATNESVTYMSLRGKFAGVEMLNRLFLANRIPVLSVLVRRDILNEVGRFDEGAQFHFGCEDYDLWLKLARHGAVFYGMTEKLVRYRVHANAMSRKKVELIKSMLTVLEKYKHDNNLSKRAARKGFGNLYRGLIVALIEEGRITEVGESMKELSAWDNFGPKTLLHKILLKALPGTVYVHTNNQLRGVMGRLRRLRQALP